MSHYYITEPSFRIWVGVVGLAHERITTSVVVDDTGITTSDTWDCNDRNRKNTHEGEEYAYVEDAHHDGDSDDDLLSGWFYIIPDIVDCVGNSKLTDSDV
jgi:hypothetical protein